MDEAGRCRSAYLEARDSKWGEREASQLPPAQRGYDDLFDFTGMSYSHLEGDRNRTL